MLSGWLSCFSGYYLCLNMPAGYAGWNAGYADWQAMLTGLMNMLAMLEMLVVYPDISVWLCSVSLLGLPACFAGYDMWLWWETWQGILSMLA
jgi:hypothetical protein